MLGGAGDKAKERFEDAVCKSMRTDYMVTKELMKCLLMWLLDVLYLESLRSS